MFVGCEIVTLCWGSLVCLCVLRDAKTQHQTRGSSSASGERWSIGTCRFHGLLRGTQHSQRFKSEDVQQVLDSHDLSKTSNSACLPCAVFAHLSLKASSQPNYQTLGSNFHTGLLYLDSRFPLDPKSHTKTLKVFSLLAKENTEDFI